ncbi:MAG TPA: DUF4058 family protein [Tepidisphaeraceae bacterium]|jgi:hypothetical protein|nr:DUF4058 family protein [Tepidisphaeraceae bacterium]
MPLLDHFNPPLHPARHWESFHSQWAGEIANVLNRQLLPANYFAEIQVHVGSRVEIDVAAMHDEAAEARSIPDEGGVAVATRAARPWSAPAAVMSMPALFPDSIEVLVYGMESGYTLVAALELVSPGNKDRAETRRGFAAKCATYLQQGIGLIVVDVVTDRGGNLHNELVALLGAGAQFITADEQLYAVAYRPVRRPNDPRIDVWPASLAVGRPLPTLPLALDKGLCLPLDLEAPYVEACRRSRIP